MILSKGEVPVVFACLYGGRHDGLLLVLPELSATLRMPCAELPPRLATDDLQDILALAKMGNAHLYELTHRSSSVEGVYRYQYRGLDRKTPADA